jgi:hypothetical protein
VDVIRFDRRYDSDVRCDVVDVAINGTRLIEQVAAYERKTLRAEDSPNAAGHYVGLPARDVAPPSRLFLGATDGWFCAHPGIVSILTCTCGELGCGSLTCFVRVQGDRVAWEEFEGALGPLGADGRRKSHYDGFGAFVFDRKQYETALSELASTPTP